MAAIALVLIGCGGKERSSGSSDTGPQSQTESVPEIAQETAPAAAPAAPVAKAPDPCLFEIEYASGRNGRERMRSTALAIGKGNAEDSKPVNYWMVALHGMEDIGTYGSIEFSMRRLSAESQTPSEQSLDRLRGRIIRRIPDSDLYLLESEFAVEVPNVIRQAHAGKVLSGLLASPPAGVAGLVFRAPASLDMEGGKITFAADSVPVESQNLVPLVTEGGDLAGLAIRGMDGEWSTRRLPEIPPLLEPVLGPFEVSGSYRSPSGDLQIKFTGPFQPGSARGEFRMVLGPETEALQGFDSEGRRILKDPAGGGGSNMLDQGIPYHPASAGTSVDFRLRMPKDRPEQVLVGQVIRRERGGTTVPYPPFTLKLQLDDPMDLRVTDGGVFVAEADRTGKSSSPFLGETHVTELPEQAAINQACLSPAGIVLVPGDSGPVRIYQPGTRQLLQLPSSLSGASVLAACDNTNIYLLDRKSGVIEKWDAMSREMTTAGIIDNAGEILALAAIGMRPEPVLVMLCKDRFRFVRTSNLGSASPALLSYYGSTSVPDEDDFEIFGKNPPRLEDGASCPGFGDAAAMFRGIPGFSSSESEVDTVALYPDARPGRIAVMQMRTGFALSPAGNSVFQLPARFNPGEFLLLRRPNTRDMRWQPAKNTGNQEVSWCGFFPALDGGDLVLAANHDPGALPPRGPKFSIHAVQLAKATPVELGSFDELSGCAAPLRSGQPWLARHVFFLPGQDAIVTLDDRRGKIYHRQLRTKSVMDSLASGSFMILGRGPENIYRGRTVEFPIEVAGCAKPEFTLTSSPEGASLTADGRFQWPCPEMHAGDSASIRIKVTDHASGRSLDQPIELEIFGEPPASVGPPGSKDKRRVAQGRIFTIPHQGVIIAKRDVDRGHRQVMVTETPGGGCRLEVFDATAETWFAGADLPARPAACVANPKLVYLVYPERGMMELRAVDEPAKVREVPLKLPIVAIGCSRDTTAGVLCLVEKLNPDKEKIGEFVDWDGSRVTVTRSLGQHSRLVFLSPLGLKPLPISGTAADMNDAVFFLGRQSDGPIDEIVLSADGLKAACKHRFIDFGNGSGQLRLGTQGTGSQPEFISDDGRLIYGSGDQRQMMTRKIQGTGPVFEPHPSKLERGSWVRPLSGTTVDLVLHINPTQDRLYPLVEIVKRDDQSSIMTIEPLWEIQRVSRSSQDRQRVELVSMCDKKLVTIGHRHRELWLRDIGTP
jgi:hypothetical protein